MSPSKRKKLKLTFFESDSNDSDDCVKYKLSDTFIPNGGERQKIHQIGGNVVTRSARKNIVSSPNDGQVASTSAIQNKNLVSSPNDGQVPSSSQIQNVPKPQVASSLGLQVSQPNMLPEMGRDERQNQPINSLFESEQTIFQNDKFAVIVQKQDHVRQKVFRLEDHLFVVRVKLKSSSKPPLLRDIIHIMEAAMSRILDDIKASYNDKETNLVYITLKQDGMLNAIRSGGFNLELNNDSILHFVLSMFSKYLNSNENLRLENSFCIYFKTFSSAHLNWSKSRRKPPMRQSLGNYNASCSLADGCVKLLPSFRLKFENMCLLVGVIIAFNYFKLFQCKDTHTLANLQYLWLAKCQEEENRAQKQLENELQLLLSKTNLPSNGPYSVHDALPILSTFYNCQIHIIKSSQEKHFNIISYPEKWNLNLAQIFLHQGGIDHVDPVINLYEYFRKNRQFCLLCKKTFSKFYDHVCSDHSRFCNYCYCPKTDVKLDKLTYLPFKFCPLSSDVHPSITCLKCKVTFWSLTCFKNHMKKICLKKGFFCHSCDFFVKFQKPETHSCLKKDERFCYVCKGSYKKGETHMCHLLPEVLNRFWPKLVFFTFETQSGYDSSCISCFNIRKEKIYSENNTHSWNDIKYLSTLKCKLHQVSYDKEAVLCTIWEEVIPGKFKCFLLANDNLEIMEQPTYFEYNYDRNQKRPVVEKRNKRRLINETVTKLNEVAQKKCKSVLDKFLLFVMQQSNKHSVFLSLNELNENMSIVLEVLSSIDLCPKVFKNENCFMSIMLECQNLTFINVSNYFSGGVEDIANQFQLQDEPLRIFPTSWNSLFFKYSGPKPCFEAFQNFWDTDRLVEAKKCAYFKLCCDNWNFKDELCKRSKYKVAVLAKACLFFIKETFDFQFKLLQSLNLTSFTFLYPFSSQIWTLPSYSYKMFYTFYKIHEKLYAVQNENFTVGTINVSNGEYQLAMFLQHKHPNYQFKHAFSSSEGQQKFGKYLVDIYSPVTKTIIQYQGCALKNHIPPSCINLSRKNLTSDNVISPFKKTFRQTERDIEVFKNYIMTNHSCDVSHIKYIYECEWNKFKKTQEYKDFFNNCEYPLNRPITRLIPRVALRSGLTEIYSLRWSAKDSPLEIFKIADVNSLYSKIAMSCKFPTGKVKTLIGDDLKLVNIKNNKLYFKDEPLTSGQIHCSILAPQNEFYPFLQYRVNNEFNYLGLCKTCVTKNLSICRHTSEKSRKFTSTWTLEDINKALELNYKIVSIYEIHYFSTTTYLLKHFVQCLTSYRLKYSNSFDTELEKKMYCENINTKLDLPLEFRLKPSDLCHNNSQSHMYKLCMNSLFGKFSMHKYHSTHEIVFSQHRLEEIFSQFDVISVNNLNIGSVIVEYKKMDRKPNLKSNIYVGASINSQARIYIYEYLKKIESVGGKVYAIDTDCLFYTLPINALDPLPYSEITGDFKTVIPQNCQVVSFHSLGSKNYSLLFQNLTTGKFENVVKVKGLSLTSSHLPVTINASMYEDYIDSNFKKEAKTLVVPQVRKKCKRPFFNKEPVLQKYSFKNDLFLKRFVRDDNYITYPYGFVCQK